MLQTHWPGGVASHRSQCRSRGPQFAARFCHRALNSSYLKCQNTSCEAAPALQTKLVICCELSAAQSPATASPLKLQPARKQLRVTHGDRYISKEVRSLVKQIEMSMAANRKAGSPFDLHVTSWQPGSDMDVFGQWIKADTWPVTRHARAMHSLFELDKVIMLSPDAKEPLLHIDPGQTYTIGGIVDRSVCKGLTLGHAAEHQLVVRRLPVQEHSQQLEMGEGTSRSPVLNISDVVIALVAFQLTGDWVHALRQAIPQRKVRSPTPRVRKPRRNTLSG